MRRSLVDPNLKAPLSPIHRYLSTLNSFVSSVPRKPIAAGHLPYSPSFSAEGASPRGRATGALHLRCWMMLIGHPAPPPSPTPPTPPSPPTGPTSMVMQRAEDQPVDTLSPRRTALKPPCDWLHQNRLGVWIVNSRLEGF